MDDLVVWTSQRPRVSRLNSRKHAHQHEKAVHFAEDVLGACVLYHDTMDFDEDLCACSGI